uniref:Uncharacterized protein n=1 Tax=Anopheles culicifacies TaxID=139723 RepID=A0A182MBE2_9DIPT
MASVAILVLAKIASITELLATLRAQKTCAMRMGPHVVLEQMLRLKAFVAKYTEMRSSGGVTILMMLCILIARLVMLFVVIPKIGKQSERCIATVTLVRIVTDVRFHMLHHVVALRKATLANINAGKTYTIALFRRRTRIRLARLIMCFVVIAEIRKQPKRFVTTIALVRVVTDVYFHMLHHIVTLREAPLTILQQSEGGVTAITLIRIVTDMCSHMLYQNVALCEATIAVRTFVRLFTGVGQHVTLYMIR